METFCLLTDLSFLDLYLSDIFAWTPLVVIGFINFFGLFWEFKSVVLLFSCFEKLGYFA
jgi:hypothetical protein